MVLLINPCAGKRFLAKLEAFFLGANQVLLDLLSSTLMVFIFYRLSYSFRFQHLTIIS